MATNVVSASSELVRKRWMREGLVQAASKSFFAPYTGNTKDSIVFQTNNESAAEGHTVVFDFDGNLSGKAIKGKDTAYGKGEQKKKFSNTLTVDRYRLVADNGDKFDAVNVGDLSTAQHVDSRNKLSDLFIRFKDQALFDAAQGFKDGTVLTHRIFTDASSTKLSYSDLVNVEATLRTGSVYSASNPFGYSVGDDPGDGLTTASTTRAPLSPFRMADGRSIWLLVVDPFTAANLKSNATVNSGVMALAQHADMRGNNNRVFKGLIGQVGQLVIVEAEAFFGSTSSTGLDGSEIEIAGLRQWDESNGVWSGDSSYATAEYSRNIIMGAGALQIGFGKQPDYKYQESQDFGIKSESALEVWMDTQRTILTAEQSDYSQAKIASMDFGVVAWDVKL